MTDIKAAKDQPPGIAQDMAEAYTVKMNLSEHELELEQALQNYVPDSAAERALVRKLDMYMGIMIIWGSICAVMSVVKNYHGMLALRFFLGCKRFSIFYTASVCSGAVSGLLAGAITGNMEGVRGIRGWRWLYLIEGVCTVLFVVGLKFILLDFPETTRRLSLQERQLAVVRMMHDRNTTAARHGRRLTHWQSLKAALADPRTYVFAVLFTMDLGSCTISYFIPAIVRQMGYASTTAAQYMTMPIWTVGAAFLVAPSYTADRTGDRRWHVTGCMGLSFVCAVVCATASDPRGGVVALPAEKRAVVVALVNSVGNLSAVYGSRLWPSSDGPRFVKGFATTWGLYRVRDAPGRGHSGHLFVSAQRG
ncbi:putative transporter [Colletotrichum trifolii]|uniref:Putative transporter n=1 Tax=Colletotrichum trifolii TaxID=5466 RepID=A0A4R8RKL3_COLTR|nr:putative transporter [Colletotrichum trifolii]